MLYSASTTNAKSSANLAIDTSTYSTTGGNTLNGYYIDNSTYSTFTVPAFQYPGGATQTSFTTWSYSWPSHSMVFTIAGVAFCIDNYDQCLDNIINVNKNKIDYRNLRSEDMMRISSILMKRVEDGEFSDMPVLLFLMVYTAIKDNTVGYTFVCDILKRLKALSSSGAPTSILVGDEEGEIIRLTVLASAELEALSELY